MSVPPYPPESRYLDGEVPFRRPPLLGETISDGEICMRLYGIVSNHEYDSEMYKKISSYLLSRMNMDSTVGRKPISIGRVENFELEMKYVKPITESCNPFSKGNFRVSLSPWRRGNKYIVMLENENSPRGSPILVMREGENSLVGAMHVNTKGVRSSGTSSFLYDAPKIKALFGIEDIVPFKPSNNYRALTEAL